MNNQKAPFNDVRVRQAINYAIDKDAYCAVVKNGLATPADSIIGTNVQFHKANDVYKVNIEKAKELLADAGYPDGFTTTLMYAKTTANEKQATFIKQQLANVGINVELDGMENAILQEKVSKCTEEGANAEVNMYTIGWSLSTGDADWGIRPLMAIESEPPMSYNICYYENEKVDALLYDALGPADPAKRAECYAEIQDIIWEDSPLVCLAFDSNTWANNKNIINVGNMPDGGLWIRNARMAAKIEELKSKVKKALSKDFSKGRIEMPEKFVYKANYKDLKKAYQMSFFPGVKAIDERTNCVESDNYHDIVVAHSFIVY